MNQPAWADGVCKGLRATGCSHLVYVPDNPLSHIVSLAATDYAEMPTTLATREEEAIGIAAGLYLGRKRPVVMMQSSGLGNAVNALASLLIAYQIPALLVVSMRGDPGEWNWAQVPMGRAVRPILDALGVQHLPVETPGTAETVVRACGTLAFGTRQPVAVLLPRRLTVPA